MKLSKSDVFFIMLLFMLSLFLFISVYEHNQKIDAVSEENAVQGFDISDNEAVQGFELEEEF